MRTSLVLFAQDQMKGGSNPPIALLGNKRCVLAIAFVIAFVICVICFVIGQMKRKSVTSLMTPQQFTLRLPVAIEQKRNYEFCYG